MPWDSTNNPLVAVADPITSTPSVLKLDNDGDLLLPGSYQTSSGDGPFGVELDYVEGGVWEFNDLGAASVNVVSIGKSTDRFFLKSGSELTAIDPQGIFALDISFANIEITGSTAANEYVIELKTEFSTPPAGASVTVNVTQATNAGISTDVVYTWSVAENQTWGNYFKVTDAPGSVTPLTSFTVVEGVPKTLYVIGPAQSGNGVLWAAGFTTGMEIVATNTGGVVTYSQVGTSRFGDASSITNYLTQSYNDFPNDSAITNTLNDAFVFSLVSGATAVHRLTDGDLLDFTSGTNALVTDQSATLVAEQIRVVSAKTWTIGTQREVLIKLETFEDDPIKLTLGSSYLGSGGQVVNVSANHIDDVIENSSTHKPSIAVTTPGTLTINRDDSAQSGVSTIGLRVTIEDAVPEPVFVEPTMAIVIPATNFTPEITAETTAPTLPTSPVNRTASFSYIGLSNGKGLLKMNQAWVIGGIAGADDGDGDYIWRLPPGYAVDPDLIDPVAADTRGQRSWGVATLVTDSQSNGNDNHIVGEIILHADGVKIYVDDDGNAIDRQFISDSHYSLADTDQEYKFQCEIPVIRTAEAS